MRERWGTMVLVLVRKGGACGVERGRSNMFLL